MRYRQVERLANRFLDTNARDYAHQQLATALIIHWQPALATAKTAFWYVCKGKCMACGVRHIKRMKPVTKCGFSTLGCEFGYLSTLRTFFPRILNAAFHGWD